MAVVMAVVMAGMLLVSEGIVAYEKKDGSWFLIAMQVAAFAAACIWQRKETATFFICAVLVAMFKFYIVDAKSAR